MFDMMGMMGKMKDLQEKMKQAQDNLKNITVTAEAGAGMVKAKANGQRKLLSIEIDEVILKKENAEMISDLVVAAVNKALDEASEKGQAELKKQTAGMMPNIPGLELSNFGL